VAVDRRARIPHPGVCRTDWSALVAAWTAAGSWDCGCIGGDHPGLRQPCAVPACAVPASVSQGRKRPVPRLLGDRTLHRVRVG